MKPWEVPFASTSQTSHRPPPLAHNCAVVVAVRPEMSAVTCAGIPLARTRLKSRVFGADASLRRSDTVIFVPAGPVHGPIEATAESLFSHSRCDVPLALPEVGPTPPAPPPGALAPLQSGQNAPINPCDVPLASTTHTSHRPFPLVHS